MKRLVWISVVISVVVALVFTVGCEKATPALADSGTELSKPAIQHPAGQAIWPLEWTDC